MKFKTLDENMDVFKTFKGLKLKVQNLRLFKTPQEPWIKAVDQ